MFILKRTVGVAAITSVMALAGCGSTASHAVSNSATFTSPTTAPTTTIVIAVPATAPSTTPPTVPPTVPPVTAPPATTPPTAAPSCTPISDEGTCYEPGEYCRDDDHGVSGIAGDGKRITCEDNDGWRWEDS